MAGRKRARLAARRKAMGLSQERLAEAVGVDTSTVARWERGETEPIAFHRPRLAEALKITAEEVGELLDGVAAPPTAQRFLAPSGLAELPPGSATAADDHVAAPYAWAALRTVEDLAVFLRSDMLNRRDILATSITMAAGIALTEPVARWLRTSPGGLPATAGHGLGRIGTSELDGIEGTVRYFVASDGAAGGGLSREAAVGQLKYAIDHAQHASYSEAVGTRLLTVIADLAGWVGWMSHDAGLPGAAQRYTWYGIQAAHEAGTEQARLRAVGLLDDLSEYAREAGQLDTASRFIELARERVPDDPRRYHAVRASLRGRQARVLSQLGSSRLSEVDRCVNLSFDLHSGGRDDESTPWLADYFPYSCDGGTSLAHVAAEACVLAAHADARFAARAERHARDALDRGEGFASTRTIAQVTLARARLRAGDLDQACADSREAIRMAAAVGQSRRVRTRLAQLMADTDQHQREPAVRELREELRVAARG